MATYTAQQRCDKLCETRDALLDALTTTFGDGAIETEIRGRKISYETRAQALKAYRELNDLIAECEEEIAATASGNQTARNIVRLGRRGGTSNERSY